MMAIHHFHIIIVIITILIETLCITLHFKLGRNTIVTQRPKPTSTTICLGIKQILHSTVADAIAIVRLCIDIDTGRVDGGGASFEISVPQWIIIQRSDTIIAIVETVRILHHILLQQGQRGKVGRVPCRRTRRLRSGCSRRPSIRQVGRVGIVVHGNAVHRKAALALVVIAIAISPALHLHAAIVIRGSKRHLPIIQSIRRL
mmetsp:Transcript_19231/g.41685  ORF Transcript_19231/g.41685 Transcript_19231/m.41685 type:complete len:202 (+) Transcript_19231:3159-3764(+)